MALSESMEGEDMIMNNLSYKIFSKLESDWLFGNKLWIPQLLQELVVENPMGAPPQPPPSSRGKVCVLSIDGGGTRSIIAARALAYLEEALKRKSGNPDAAIADYFDVAAGTGSGGILTTMLFASGAAGRPLFRAADTWRTLAEKGKKMFSPSGNFISRLLGAAPAAYSAKKLERVLKSWFVKGDGKCHSLKDTVKPVLIPCYDLSTAAPFLFSRADALESDNYDFKLWEVCRATSATPGLFSPMNLRSVDDRTSCTALDGGLVMNNPAVAAVTHVLHNKREFPWVNGVDDLLVLSLGTGQFDGCENPGRVSEWGKRKGSSAMKILLDGLSDAADHVITTAFGDHNRQNYVRVQATGLPDKSVPEMDDASESNMRKLAQISEKMLKEKSVESVPFGGKRLLSQTNAQRLEWFADQLIAEQQARSTRKVPTVVIKHTDKELTNSVL